MTLSDERLHTAAAALPAEGETTIVGIGPLTLESGVVLDDVNIAVQRWASCPPNATTWWWCCTL